MIIENVFTAINAIKAGESLKNAASWKNKQILMNVFLIIITTLFEFGNIDISEADINSIAYGLATLGVAVNSYLTAATSEKVGL
jgi:hypothetical protein